MGIFSRLLGLDPENDHPELLLAIKRAISGVEPLLKQVSGYPDSYSEAVATALEYARGLAASIPGPIAINRETYAMDPFVHALFPSANFIKDALNASQSMRDYHCQHPAASEVYALMGMRRDEKTMLGMELSGQLIQRDVPQNIVYFTSHTIEHPASSEKESRDLVAWGFFDNLVDNVAKRIAMRKQKKQSLMQEKDMLAARLHTANAQTRTALEEELNKVLSSIQAAICSLDLRSYLDDFKAVLLNPEQYLRLDQTAMVLDSMGIRRKSTQEEQGQPVVFNDLIGFDRRKWTVALVYCSNMQIESSTAQREATYRKLAVYT